MTGEADHESTGPERTGPEREDRAGEQLTRLLTELANDPAAPPSAVDALSVIRAARAAGGIEPGRAEPGDTHNAESQTMAPNPAGAPDGVLPFRSRRRRTALVALLAAASVAAVAALVIPLSLSGGSSTSTSADAERVVAVSGTPPAGPAEDAAGAAQAEPPAVGSATDLATAPEAAQAGPDAPQADQSETDPTVENSAGAAGGLADGAPCWPALAEPVEVALLAALPAGAFGDPAPLTGECPGGAVGAAELTGLNPPPGTTDAFSDAAAEPVLVVRVSKAEPGACTSADTPVGATCGAQPDGTYLTTGGAGDPTVFAYGNGDEVAIGGSPNTGARSGLSVEQLAAAAQAVVSALG